MAIYYRCKNCRSDFSIKLKACPFCGTPLPKENRMFRIDVSYNKKRVRKTITGSLAIAKEVEAKIRAELIGGEYYDRRQKAKQETTLNEFFNAKYLPVVQKEKKSWDRDAQHFRDYISPIVGKKKLNEISPFDVEKIKKHLADEGKAPRTIEYVLATLRHIINKAKDWGYFEGENPTSKVKKPKADNRRIRFLTPEEAQMLLDELKKHSQQVYEMALLSLHTGMRAGEIFNLKWGDIDLKNGIIHIKDPKSGENRTAYITDKIKSIFENKTKKPDEYVFKDAKGNKIKKISHTFFRVVDKLGLNDGITDDRDKVVFHTLRHTFASWLAMQGTPIYTIKELMGHKTLAMTERYSHLMPDVKRNAVDSIDRMMEQRVVKLERGTKNDSV